MKKARKSGTNTDRKRSGMEVGIRYEVSAEERNEYRQEAERNGGRHSL